jgi:hypothetical protein
MAASNATSLRAARVGGPALLALPARCDASCDETSARGASAPSSPSTMASFRAPTTA